ASHGYIVASMDYPMTNFNAPGGPLVKDVVNQPGDVSFLLDQFLSWNAESGHQFYGAVDAQRLGVFGLSLGGMTTTMVAFHPELGDPRVSAAASIAGPSFMFNEHFFSHRDTPFMMVATEIDALVDYESNARPIKRKDPDATLVSIEGGTHTGFADMARLLRWMDNPDQIGCDQVKQNIGNGDDEPWYDLIGSIEQGVEVSGLPELCVMDPLPKAMNPVMQHWLTTVSIFSFFQSQFAAEEAERARYDAYLHSVLGSEMAAVTVQ
ncbi:MAG: hypothetical protein R3311_18630, partial [Oceanisphaera sp.]|nr:hypothetical protein [Oceanisphaera sp.]